jgi:hypothetical protein
LTALGFEFFVIISMMAVDRRPTLKKPPDFAVGRLLALEG